tara:strand:+ start:420 stop:806 length:387 start_codon:yes stop_codon:yes gene_type:complete
MKILNLYAGIGGNRKLWGEEHEITPTNNIGLSTDRTIKTSPKCPNYPISPNSPIKQKIMYHCYYNEYSSIELSKICNVKYDILRKSISRADYGKEKVLRNCVEPKVGLHVFNSAFKTKQQTLSFEVKI